MADVQGPPDQTSSNVFTRKLGPLPMWGWMAIVLLLAVFYYLYKKNQSTSASTPGTSSAGGSTNSSLIPQFVNQTYVENTPPPAPATTSTTPTGDTENESAATDTTELGPVNEILQQGHTINPNPHKAEIGWTIKQKSPYATQLKVVLNGPGHKNQTRYIPATATTATFEGLSPGHTYVADITPVDAAGQAVGGPNHVTFITSKG